MLTPALLLTITQNWVSHVFRTFKFPHEEAIYFAILNHIQITIVQQKNVPTKLFITVPYDIAITFQYRYILVCSINLSMISPWPSN